VSKTNLFVNWDGVQAVTQDTQTQYPIEEVTDVKVDGKSVQIAFYGDNRLFARNLRNTQKTREISITGGNIAQLLAIPEDREVTITAYLNDVDNGRGSGCLVVVAKNAKRHASPFGGQNNQYASGSVMFACRGDTDSSGSNVNDSDPISITQVP
jgi:hypothetical protein